MINPKELRIGNCVRLYLNHSDYSEFPIELADLNLIVNKGGDYFPIPLTPEILEKRGFEYNEIVGGYCDKNHVIYEWINNEWGFCMFCSNDKHSTIPIKYLHQLQNLIFDLSGEELEIKELQSA